MTVRHEFRRWLLLAALLACFSQAHGEVSVLSVDVPEHGRTLALLELPSRPLGIVVLLPGGNGRVGISNSTCLGEVIHWYTRELSCHPQRKGSDGTSPLLPTAKKDALNVPHERRALDR